MVSTRYIVGTEWWWRRAESVCATRDRGVTRPRFLFLRRMKVTEVERSAICIAIMFVW